MRQRLPVLAIRAGFDMGAAIENDLRAALAARAFATGRSLVRGRTGLLGDVTCDGSVMAEVAEFSQCDGVMDRIASDFSLMIFGRDPQALVRAGAYIVSRVLSLAGVPPSTAAPRRSPSPAKAREDERRLRYEGNFDA